MSAATPPATPAAPLGPRRRLLLLDLLDVVVDGEAADPQRRRLLHLGFAPAALTESPRIVRDLIPDSAAAKAGVHNGDEITRPVGQDQLQGKQDGILTLQLLRDGKPLTISYKPRGETVPT